MAELVSRDVLVQPFSVSNYFDQQLKMNETLELCDFLSIFSCSIATLACDHTRVTPYFIESINSPKGFYAGPCRNLLSYVLGWCEPKDNEYVLMGEHCSHK